MLRFEPSKRVYESHFVCGPDAKVDEITCTATFNESDGRSESSDDDSIRLPAQSLKSSELYHSANTVGLAIDGHSRTSNWPPKSVDLTVDKHAAAVPAVLFNFIALTVGAASEPPEDCEMFLTVSETILPKILSLSQDIISLRSRRPTPKQLALGMAMKHLTGSSRVCSLLNRYGHCSGYDSILRHETALAVHQLTTADSLPPGFSVGQPTVLVYDNNDFLELTLSGSGTTHHTNGIMVQASRSESAISPPVQVSRRQKSLIPQRTEIPAFYLSKKQGPQKLQTDNVNISLQASKDRSSSNHLREFAFICAKLSGSADEPLPGWTGYNRKITQLPTLPKSAIHYLPVIESPPTDAATVKHVLDESMKMADRLGLETITVVFDQAIYSKAQQIRWADPLIERRIVIRLGDFHTTMNYLSTIGKRFELSGLEDILVESELVAMGSLKGVLSGHNYNRSLRSHKILYEALSRLQLIDYLDSIDSDERDRLSRLHAATREEFTTSNTVDCEALVDFNDGFTDYITSQCDSSPTYKFWTSYLQMVRVVLLFVRATRESDFGGHLIALRQMLPWFFAYDRQNYAR